MIRRLFYFLREGFKILMFHKRISILATGVVALTLFVSGLFFLITENLKGMEAHWKKQQKLSIYFIPETTEEDYNRVERIIRSASYAESYHFIDQDQALVNFKQTFPSLEKVVDVVGENPFSSSLQVTLQPGYENQVNVLVEKLKLLPGVSDVQYDLVWLKKLNSFVMFLRFVGMFFGLLLGVGAVITITNVVGMATLVHQDEIRILWLVGATPAYIRGPFMVQGILLGFSGGIMSILLLSVTYHVLVHQIKANYSILWNFLTISFLPTTYLSALILAGFFCGILGSIITLRKK